MNLLCTKLSGHCYGELNKMEAPGPCSQSTWNMSLMSIGESSLGAKGLRWNQVGRSVRIFRQLPQCWHSKEPWRPGPSFRMYGSFIVSVYLLLYSKPVFKKLCYTYVSGRSRENYGFWISSLLLWLLVPLFYLWIVSGFLHYLSCHLFACLRNLKMLQSWFLKKIILDGIVIPKMSSCNTFIFV